MAQAEEETLAEEMNAVEISESPKPEPVEEDLRYLIHQESRLIVWSCGYQRP